MRHRQALLDQCHELFLAQALTPARYRGAVEGQLVAEAQLAAEVLVVRVLDPARAQHLVREVVHVLQDEEAGHQSRRQARLARTGLADRAEASIEKAPVDLARQPHQRVAQVNDLIERRSEQILLAVVSRSAHASPNADLGRQRITNREKPESQNARKRGTRPAFLQNPLLDILDGAKALVCEVAEKHVLGHDSPPLRRKQWASSGPRRGVCHAPILESVQRRVKRS